MLRYLLDEHISYVIAEQMRKKHPSVPIESVHRWKGGEFAGIHDVLLLGAAMGEGLTLVTYDQRIIAEVLYEWGKAGTPYSGIIFVKQRAIPSQQFGLLIRTLFRYWESHKHLDWTNRIAFLQRL